VSEPNEFWRDVPGYDGHYQVSDLGRVRSCKTHDGRAGPTWVLRAPQVGRKGYLMLALYKRNRQSTRYIHSLVAEAFIGPRPAGKDVAHNNGHPQDNRVTNLRWATKKENQADRLAHGTAIRGEIAYNHKLTEGAVREIRRLWAAGGVTRRELAEHFRVSESAIQQIYMGKNWAWLE
jgi:hypothetical protein